MIQFKFQLTCCRRLKAGRKKFSVKLLYSFLPPLSLNRQEFLYGPLCTFIWTRMTVFILAFPSFRGLRSPYQSEVVLGQNQSPLLPVTFKEFFLVLCTWLPCNRFVEWQRLETEFQNCRALYLCFSEEMVGDKGISCFICSETWDWDACERLILVGPEEQLPIPHRGTKRWTSVWHLESLLHSVRLELCLLHRRELQHLFTKWTTHDYNKVPFWYCLWPVTGPWGNSVSRHLFCLGTHNCWMW